MERRLVYIIGGAIVAVLVLLGVGAFVFLPQFTGANTGQATATPVATGTAKAVHKNIYAPYLQQYGMNIKTQIAQGLHMTPDQLTTELKSGKTVNDIATAQNVSAPQLQTLIATAFTTNLKPAVDAGALTQKQVDRLVKNMQNNQKSLDNFLIHTKGTSQQGTATPGAGA